MDMFETTVQTYLGQICGCTNNNISSWKTDYFPFSTKKAQYNNDIFIPHKGNYFPLCRIKKKRRNITHGKDQNNQTQNV